MNMAFKLFRDAEAAKKGVTLLGYKKKKEWKERKLNKVTGKKRMVRVV